MSNIRKDFDTNHNDNIVCPHCGYENKDDLHEYFETHSNSTYIDCNECGKVFFCERNFEVDYSTSIIPCKNGEPHKFRFGYQWESDDIYICSWCDKSERRPHSLLTT